MKIIGLPSKSMNIPGYRVLCELSRGGMAKVYLAVQEILERQVVLKVMSPNLPEDPAFKESLLHEGKIIEELRHPHIITIYNLGYAGGRYYIVMEYVSGKNLKERIQKSLTLKQSLQITIRIARALHYVHKHGIVHRDIKPSNILFKEDECPVLTDFGLATLQTTEAGRKGNAFIGTPRYVSPERVKGTPEDARSDLYSLGAMFYEMLTGTPPYVGENALATALQHVRDPVPELPERVAFLQPILNGLMAKDPAHRFRDAEEFIQALARVMRDRWEQNASLVLEPMQALMDRRPVGAIDGSQGARSRRRWCLWTHATREG